MPTTWQRTPTPPEGFTMSLATGPALRELFGKRLSGEDGYYDSFELAFFPGYVPSAITTPIYAAPLIVFPLPSPWATYLSAYGTVLTTEQTLTTTAPGVVTFFRFNGIKSAVTDPLQHGTVSTYGAGGDIQFSATGWPIGLPINLKRLYLRPPQLNF